MSDKSLVERLRSVPHDEDCEVYGSGGFDRGDETMCDCSKRDVFTPAAARIEELGRAAAEMYDAAVGAMTTGADQVVPPFVEVTTMMSVCVVVAEPLFSVYT